MADQRAGDDVTGFDVLDGLHQREDGTDCGYIAVGGFCSKCGWTPVRADRDKARKFIEWLLDQGSVCVNRMYANPVTLDLGNGWLAVPDEFHAFVLAYENAVWGDADA